MITIWLAIKAYLIAKAPEYVKDVVESFVTDGIKAGLKRLFGGKKKEPVLDAVNTLDAKMDYLISLSKSNSNATIREIAQQLNGLISSLHIRTAHDVLLKLRLNIPTSDQYTLSIVDYALGCCSRYVSKESCLAEYDRAYREMIGAERYDPDIISGKLYCLCLEKKSDEAIRMANGLREHDRNNIWAWIPSLVLADNIEETYSKLPEDIKANTVILANACMMRREETSLCVDIFKYKVARPVTLEFENIPIWIFNLSVLTNRYIREWNADAFAGDTPVGPFCKELYDYSTRFIELSEKTEIGELSVDVTLFNTITAYKMRKDTELLEKLKQCKASAQFLPVKQLAYVLFLSKENQFEEAKNYLKGSRIVNDASIYNIRFYLAVVTADEIFARETLLQLVEKKVVMPGTMLIFLLMAFRDHTESLKENVYKVLIADEVDSNVYKEVCNSFCKVQVDTQYLLDHQSDAALGLRPFMAIALYDAGLTKEALDLSESCLRDGYVDFGSHIYVDLLKKSKSYSRLNAYLRKVREGGYAENPLWLKDEYVFARKEEDFQRMLSIAEALYRLDSKNVSYYTCYLTMQYQNGHFDKVKELADKLGDYRYTPDAVTEVFNVLLLSDMIEESVEFLYTYIRNNDPNEQVSLLFHSICMNPKTAPIIRKEYDIVEDGLYVHYKHNGEERSDIIVKGQRIDCMIGKQVGETVILKDRMDRDETYEVISINNKYYQLLEEIYKAISENKFQSAFSFTIDDLTEGGGNLLDGLAKVSGYDEEWQKAHKAALEEYKQGKQTISTFFIGEEYIAELYNHLFGDFKVYNIPSNDFEELYEKREVNIDEQEFVLDLSSLILLYELHLKFGIDYTAKFVVPQGIVHLIDGTLAKEEYALPAGIYQSVVDRLAVAEYAESTWFKSRLAGLKRWIEDSMTVETVHEMVDVELGDDSIFEKSRYLTIEYQSAILTMRGYRVMVSEDIAMTTAFGKGFPVADVNLIISHFHQDIYVDVSHFFIESDIYGGGMDVEYVLQQYDLYVLDKDSSFSKCKENLFYSLYLYPVILNFCSRITQKKIMTAIDTLTIDTMLRTMFGKLEQKTAFSVVVSAYKQLPHLRQELLTAYKAVYPLYM